MHRLTREIIGDSPKGKLIKIVDSFESRFLQIIETIDSIQTDIELIKSKLGVGDDD